MKTKRSGIALSIVAAATLFAAPAVKSADHLVRPYDWTIEMKTKRLDHQFEYHNSNLHGVEELKIQYVHNADDSHPDPHPQNFECFWYHDGKPLGMERRHSFDITQGDGVSINVKFSDASPTNNEYKAAANGILRVIVDCYLNKNAVVNIRIPPDAFSGIQTALREEGCLDNLPEDEHHTLATAINLFLQTEPDPSQTATMYYI